MSLRDSTTHHQERFIPYLSFLTLWVYAIGNQPEQTERNKRVVMG